MRKEAARRLELGWIVDQAVIVSLRGVIERPSSQEVNDGWIEGEAVVGLFVRPLIDQDHVSVVVADGDLVVQAAFGLGDHGECVKIAGPKPRNALVVGRAGFIPGDHDGSHLPPRGMGALDAQAVVHAHTRVPSVVTVRERVR